MSIDPLLALASFGIGIVVGLTGMGGGALITPVLVLLLVLVFAPLLWMLVRRRHGFPALVSRNRRK